MRFLEIILHDRQEGLSQKQPPEHGQIRDKRYYCSDSKGDFGYMLGIKIGVGHFRWAVSPGTMASSLFSGEAGHEFTIATLRTGRGVEE